MSNKDFTEQDVKENKILAIIMSVFPFLFFVAKVDPTHYSPYLTSRANQSLLEIIVIFALELIVFIAASITGGIISVNASTAVSVISTVISVLSVLINILCLGIYGLGIYNAVKSDEVEEKIFPVFGSITILK